MYCPYCDSYYSNMTPEEIESRKLEEDGDITFIYEPTCPICKKKFLYYEFFDFHDTMTAEMY